MPDYLHKHAEFFDLLRTVGRTHQENIIQDALVEKDYWIMHVLYALKQQGFKYQLKGGTSLSKGFGIINRFSEDIDVLIEPPEGRGVKAGKNHNKPSHCESRKEYYDWLAKEIKVEGILSIERDKEFDDEKFRSGGIRLKYPTLFDPVEGLKEGILLEVGFDNVIPNRPVDISSWALNFAIEKKVNVINNTATKVACYDPGYTFVEKLQTIVRKHRQHQECGELKTNFIRHYYDVMCLLGEKDVQAFIGTSEYLKHKDDRFAGPEKNIDLSKAEAFLLTDENTKSLYAKEYEKRKNLFYKEPPGFDELLGVIQKNLNRL